MNDLISRRQALKRIFNAIVASGASSFISFSDLLAADANLKAGRDGRINLVWLHGASCSGCSISLLNIGYVPVVDVLTKFVSLTFHQDISSATGHQAIELNENLMESGQPYVFAMEGGIPAGMPHACMMGERPITEWVEMHARKAIACIAVGTCSAAGGIPKMKGTDTGSLTLVEFLQSKGIDKPVINLPNCAVKPDHFVYTVLHYAKLGRWPELDKANRPLHFFAKTVHEECIHYADFQEEKFALHIGEEGCLFKLGCQGPITKNDDLITGHNGNVNSCIRSGHPCIGCASEHFPRQIMFHAADDERVIQSKGSDWKSDS